MTERSCGVQSGFTLVEVLVVLAILSVLSTLGMVSWTAARERAELTAVANTIVLHLEESKARAVAGTGGVPHGVWFGDDRYVQFAGATYDPDDVTNAVHTLDGSFSLSVTSGEDEVVFARITGMVEDALTITVARTSDPSAARTMIVGNGGDISRTD